MKDYIELLRENDRLIAELSESCRLRMEATDFAERMLSDWRRHEQASAILDSIKPAPADYIISQN